MAIKERKSIGELWLIEIECADLPHTRVEEILLFELDKIGTIIKVDASEGRVAIRSSLNQVELERVLEEAVDTSSVLLSYNLIL